MATAPKSKSAASIAADKENEEAKAKDIADAARTGAQTKDEAAERIADAQREAEIEAAAERRAEEIVATRMREEREKLDAERAAEIEAMAEERAEGGSPLRAFILAAPARVRGRAEKIGARVLVGSGVHAELYANRAVLTRWDEGEAASAAEIAAA